MHPQHVILMTELLHRYGPKLVLQEIAEQCKEQADFSRLIGEEEKAQEWEADAETVASIRLCD